MVRDLAIDPATLFAEKPELSPLPEITLPGQWIPAHETVVLAVMNGGQAVHAEGETAGLIHPCAPGGICDPQAMATTGPIPGPVRGTPSDQLYAMASLGGKCTCTGGGGPPCGPTSGPCTVNDGNPCTSPNGLCTNGVCVVAPVSGPCPDDGDPCTDDVCSAAVCTHPPKCTDGNPCTQDICDNGECSYPPLCADDGTVCTTDCVNGQCTYVPLSDITCEEDAHNCTLDICRDGVCEHEEDGCPGNPCITVADCTADDDPCTLPPICDESTGCIEAAKNCYDGNICTTDRCNPETGECENFDFSTPIPEADLCSTYGCNISLTGLPEYLLLNDDDDNGNGKPDFEDFGPIADETDIVCVPVDAPSCALRSGPECSWWHSCEFDHWHLLQSPSRVAMYANLDREPLIIGPCPTWPLPTPWCLEGREPPGQPPSGQCTEGWEFQIVGYAGETEHCCRLRTEPIKVVKIQSLTWEKAHLTNADLGGCDNNGGISIFPDKLNPDDNPDPVNLRQQVRLVATITPPQSGVTVYFKVFDVDDPFDNENGSMPNVSVLDPNNPNVGPDNRGTESFTLPWTASAVTGAGGLPADKAEVTFVVSMQPGNNYRAAASLLQGAVDQNTLVNGQTLTPQQNADRQNIAGGIWQGYSTPLTWSQMLTVWRKLHVEVDSMSAEPTTVAARSPDWDTFDPINVLDGTATTTFEGVNGGPLSAGEVDHYEGGFLSFMTPAKDYFIRANHSYFDSNWGGTLIRILCNGGTTPQEEAELLSGPPGTARDDDPISGQLPLYYPLADDQFIRSAYAAAYILPVQVGLDLNLDRETQFQISVSDLETYFGIAYDNSQNVFGSASYWAALVVMAYQPGPGDDGDPDQYTGSNNQGSATNPHYDQGNLYGISHWDSDNASLIFVEVQRDMGTAPASPVFHDLAHTIAHEMGHTQGGWRSETADHDEGDLMTQGAPLSECCFSAPTLLRFRSGNSW